MKKTNVQNKTIILTHKNWDKPVILEKEYDLYDLYNDFAMDNDDEGIECETVDEIRDLYCSVFENVPSGTYSLDEFEELAMSILCY